MTRRNFIRVGSLGLAGLSLNDLLAGGAHADYVRDKSVVFLYLAGGPSQIETFDPKMNAPVEIRSMTGECQTRLPGVTFGGTFPKLSAMADRLAIVRSFVHGNAGHDGGKKLFGLGAGEFGLSAAYSELLGQVNSQTGMLSTTFLSPMSVGFARRLPPLMPFFYSGIPQTGRLPETHAPFHPTADEKAKKNKKRSTSGLIADMQLRLSLDRLENRRSLLSQLDATARTFDSNGAGVENHRRLAFDILRRGISQAFDLSNEDPKVVERYDTSHFDTPPHLIRGEKNGKMSAQSQSALGKQLLLARRLCESGCRFVTVGMNDWDMHGNENSFPIPDGMKYMGGALDHAVAAFLTDLEERGLSEKVLLVMAGEMGRTPRISPDKRGPGRDHWANLGALALAGGGLRMGQVIGQSDRHAGQPAADPVRPSNLISTITHTLFDMGQLRLETGVSDDLVKKLAESEPIRALM
jgi:hypothetical protein